MVLCQKFTYLDYAHMFAFLCACDGHVPSLARGDMAHPRTPKDELHVRTEMYEFC